MNPDGTRTRRPKIEAFGRRHRCPFVPADGPHPLSRSKKRIERSCTAETDRKESPHASPFRNAEICSGQAKESQDSTAYPNYFTYLCKQGFLFRRNPRFENELETYRHIVYKALAFILVLETSTLSEQPRVKRERPRERGLYSFIWLQGSRRPQEQIKVLSHVFFYRIQSCGGRRDKLTTNPT